MRFICSQYYTHMETLYEYLLTEKLIQEFGAKLRPIKQRISKNSMIEPKNGNKLRNALQVLDTLTLAGLVVVPASPTPKMRKVGAVAGDISQANAATVYTAMISAED
mgnify:CR=1 FL=1|jgi:hypothetical protein